MWFFRLGILILVATIFLVTFFCTKNADEGKKNKVLKILAIAYILVFACRFALSDRFHSLINTSMPEYGGKTSIVLQNLLRWGLNFSSLMLLTAPFLNSKNLKNILIVIVLPLLVLNFAFFNVSIYMFIGKDANIINFRTFQFAIELTIGFVIILYLIFGLKHKLGIKENTRQFFLNLLITVPFIMLASLPLDMPQMLFGETLIVMDLLTFQQHVWIALTLIILFTLHITLRDKPFSVKYSAMMVVSISMFLNYFGKFDFTQMTVGNLPFHICNLATLIIPLALITKNTFLFSFTYFINVAGALVAIILPETSAGILSYSFLVYAYEHMFAFMLPILYVSIGIMPRTSKKNLKFALISFTCYFVLVMVLNVWFYNYDSSVNYFYLNNNFIASKLSFLKPIRDLSLSFSLGSLTFTLYPLYWLIIYAGFVGVLLLTFVIYRESYHYADLNRKIKVESAMLKDEYIAFIKNLKGDVSMPVNKKEGVMIKFTHFGKTYAGATKKSVDDFNLEVKEGEVFGFLGANGAGKSTTIKSLVGILPFEEGTIEVNGYDVKNQPLNTKSLIGYVPDNHAVYERLTGRQYVNYIADLYGVPKEKREEISKDLLEKFDLTAAFDNPIKSYSHGMKQKITIIAALIHEPKVWVLDEPLTGLDPQSSYQVKKIMREHAKKGNTVFFSSHVIEVVEKVCDRVAIIKKGKLQGVYDMKEISKEGKNLVDIFLKDTK